MTIDSSIVFEESDENRWESKNNIRSVPIIFYFGDEICIPLGPAVTLVRLIQVKTDFFVVRQ